VAFSKAFTQERGVFSRILAAVLISMFVLVPFVGPAQAIENLRKPAGIVVDAKSGKVLYEDKADQTRYPASVTKVMTLYVLFQELAAGNVKLDTKMTVSSHAAKAVPTKLGLKAGSQITVENAIKSLVTLSANDMARTISEHIAGSESKFADRMTATARALGMTHTTYRNASGLPDPGQRTTVRDQAILGIAVYQHFPQYYKFFQTKSFSYNGRTYGNHNRVLGYMGAVDGIKTGYINAAGSNLLTAARKDNRHIVVVAFGFNTAGARDNKVRELVREYLPKSRQGNYVQTAQIPLPGRQGKSPVMVAQTEQPQVVQPMPLPRFRAAALQGQPQVPSNMGAPSLQALVQDNLVVASTSPTPNRAPMVVNQQPALEAANLLGRESAPQPEARPEVIGAWQGQTYTLGLGAPPAQLGRTAPSAPLLPPVGVEGESGRRIDPTTTNSIASLGSLPAAPGQQIAAVEARQPTPQGWVVQIGAAPNETGAKGLLNAAAAKVSALEDYRSYVERFEKNGQTFYRARFTGFGGRDAATKICNALKQADLSCLAMQS